MSISNRIPQPHLFYTQDTVIVHTDSTLWQLDVNAQTFTSQPVISDDNDWQFAANELDRWERRREASRIPIDGDFGDWQMEACGVLGYRVRLVMEHSSAVLTGVAINLFVPLGSDDQLHWA